MSTIAALEPGFIVLVVVLVVLGIIGLIMAMFFKTWLRAKLSNAPVSWGNLIGMLLRKVPFGPIVDARITAVKAGLPLTSEQLEAHYLSGGDVEDVVLALIAADKANINLPFDRACAIDLAVKGTSKTVLEAVRTSINPKVIECPNPETGVTKITAVAKDGIGVNVRARVTVRTNLDSFIGGATEETVIARVGEGIVTSVGSAESYKAVLENPDSISKLVLSKGVDSSTAFEILSIDIADVDVADNVGARLQTEQAEADKRVAQAKAEMRRAAAVAVEQEMSARTQEMRAKVVEAEAQVPQAIADAFRSGNLGVMDYTRYKNVVADTDMRSSIAGDEGSEPEPGHGAMILAFDLSDLPTDAIVIFAMVAVSFLGWLKNKFLDKPEEIETPDQDDPMREIIWRRQMGENSEETRMPWEEAEVVTPTIRFDPPPVPRQTAAPSPPPPPLPSVTEVSAKEENLANAFERRTRRGKSSRSGHRRTIDRFLRSPSAAKEAILLTEILGPPAALKAEQRIES